ncbi:MAG: type I methionyl aminopeptidase [Candidatus Eiseniibacteriota bacterium]|nr:MAG: type I methionyl aminopeptidase [Candidatus Eisenbacteria bacterium]
MIRLKTKEQIARITESCIIVADTLEALGRIVEPGLSTIELDRWAVDLIKARKGVPAFKDYRGFPANICVSVNEEVVHGIPGGRALVEGDIVSIDVGVLKDGYFGDGAATFPVGEISEEAQTLLEVTQLSLMKGVEKATPDNHLGDVSHSIQECVERFNLSVVRDLVGHGVGLEMHEDPQIPNYGKAGCGPLLVEGMVLAIEPMVNAGGWEVETLDDRWTVVTKDRSLSAHFEHTVAVCENGARILTQVESAAPRRS